MMTHPFSHLIHSFHIESQVSDKIITVNQTDKIRQVTLNMLIEKDKETNFIYFKYQPHFSLIPPPSIPQMGQGQGNHF